MMIINDKYYPNNKIAYINTNNVYKLELDEHITNHIIINHIKSVDTFIMNVSNCKNVVFPKQANTIIIICKGKPYGFEFNTNCTENLVLDNTYLRTGMIKKMPNLQNLHITNTTGCLTQAKLRLMPELRKLHIECPNTIRTFSCCPKLEYLRIKTPCPNLKNKCLSNLWYLTEMHIANTNIKSSMFKYVPYIDSLYVENCSGINDTACKYLNTMTMLCLKNQKGITGQYFKYMYSLKLVIDVDKCIKPEYQKGIEYITQI